MRKTPLTILAALALTGSLLTACGNAPGSVAGDPLAVKLVDAEKKMQDWDAIDLTMVIHAGGAASSGSIPCIAMTTSKKPTESFSMRYVKSSTSSTTCSGSDDDTVRIDYSGDTIYVTEPAAGYDGAPQGCQNKATSHQVSAGLAQEFVTQQTNQAKMADLMKAATKISGDDHHIAVTLDTEAMVKLGKSSIPSGVDPDDIDVTAEADLDDAGALTSLTMTVDAGDTGSIEIDTHYAKATSRPTMPDAKCVTEGSTADSLNDIKGYLT